LTHTQNLRPACRASIEFIRSEYPPERVQHPKRHLLTLPIPISLIISKGTQHLIML
jgi:hypothetical protein